MLYVIATPIGNLEDITYRAIKTLILCDYILCEDTRKSPILLNHYKIKKKLLPFHKFSEKKEEEKIIQDLKEGKNIACISDAGTPLISDPGLSLLQRCQKENISYEILPGPCSVIQALTMSGFSTEKFQFCGFVPKKETEKRNFFYKMFLYRGTSIAFETALRIEKTLKLIETLDPKRKIAIAREMTKKFEELLTGNAKDLLDHFQKKPPKGEMVLLLEEKDFSLEKCSLDESISLLKEFHGLSTKDAIKTSAKIFKMPKRDLYKKTHKKK